MADRKKTWKSGNIGFIQIPWVEKSLFLGQFFTLATIMILILPKSGLNDQKLRILIGKKSTKNRNHSFISWRRSFVFERFKMQRFSFWCSGPSFIGCVRFKDGLGPKTYRCSNRVVRTIKGRDLEIRHEDGGSQDRKPVALCRSKSRFIRDIGDLLLYSINKCIYDGQYSLGTVLYIRSISSSRNSWGGVTNPFFEAFA